ncbi:MAG: response regulator [Anaerolineae bacterium]
MKVLLVDDHPLVRDGIASLLVARGLEVVGEAGDGVEALHKARQLHPDIILMDIRMPGLNGLEATRLIKTEMPEVKIVMLTVSDDDQDLFEAIKSGAEGYLLKSLEREQIFALLEGIDRGEAPIAPGMAAKILKEFSQRAGDGPERETTVPSREILTKREREVLRLVVKGRSNKEIARTLTISENTVKFHLKNILAKLHARNRTEAVAYALQTGLLRVSSADRSR